MSVLKRLSFNLWYFWRPPWDTGISPPELTEFIASRPPGMALDMGCGTGTNAITLAKNGWRVTGVDFAPRAIKTARRKALHAGLDVDLRVDDVTRLDEIHGPFDLILDMGCFHGLTQEGKEMYIRNLERLMAPGSVLLLYVFFRENQASGGPGVVEADLEKLAGRFSLQWRKDSSERGLRPSAWLSFTL